MCGLNVRTRRTLPCYCLGCTALRVCGMWWQVFKGKPERQEVKIVLKSHGPQVLVQERQDPQPKYNRRHISRAGNFGPPVSGGVCRGFSSWVEAAPQHPPTRLLEIVVWTKAFRPPHPPSTCVCLQASMPYHHWLTPRIRIGPTGRRSERERPSAHNHHSGTGTFLASMLPRVTSSSQPPLSPTHQPLSALATSDQTSGTSPPTPSHDQAGGLRFPFPVPVPLFIGSWLER